jgi:hypothetical protein
MADSENLVKIDQYVRVVVAPTIARREGLASDLLHYWDGAQSDERDGHRVGAHAVAGLRSLAP